MRVWCADEQMYQYSGYDEMQPTPLANDVAATYVLIHVVNAQRPRYNQVCNKVMR